MSIDFAQSTTAFAADGNVQTVTSQLTSATTAAARTLVDSTTAQTHLSSTIWAVYAGNYTGTFSGSDTGTFGVTITTSGDIVGTGLSNTSGGFLVQGQVSTSGTLSFASGGTSSGATFSGSLVNGVLSGTWQNGIDSGTYTGSLASGNITTGGGAGGVYGSLTMTGSGAVPGTFTPDATTGSSQGASQGFLQTLWSTIGTNFWTLSASIAQNYSGINGAEITFGEFGVEYSCQSGFVGTYGDCTGVTFDDNARTVSFTNVQLQAPGLGTVITLNGTLKY